mmetsp:Transcript_210/g.302  ORF Transcript_210/g.302 Transcript_210/m.302 type:complete len:101 (-) Transcript_210:66-368(-)|eukprot:CAMPEP_0113608924 /NCGR_PEP_ID=MMETSP0017_2-20120614/4190_1 /TAXON_ID=2856 /ORGANISM="Cylindrotheca closterium" /LENGTH=100 /DNA_ID=CAMNT_0000517653 /DNA_START=78 /DNA_END=380 /DNA_ORIENTATION=+ /assembly_acc=CAM_ASM_000147
MMLHFPKLGQIVCPSLGLRAVGTAILDGITAVPGPGDKSLKEVITRLEDRTASLKGLEDDPCEGEEHGDRPCDEHKKDQPAQSVDRIRAHFQSSIFLVSV